MPSWQWIKDFLHNLSVTREEEWDCEETDRLLDQYAEMVARGEDAAALLPLVRQHLEQCAGCQEEYEVLVKILADAAPGTPPRGA